MINIILTEKYLYFKAALVATLYILLASCGGGGASTPDITLISKTSNLTVTAPVALNESTATSTNVVLSIKNELRSMFIHRSPLTTTVRFDAATQTVIVNPIVSLYPGTEYTLTFSNILDSEGNPVSIPTAHFKTYVNPQLKRIYYSNGIIQSYSLSGYNDDGKRMRTIRFTGSGADGEWFTEDDAVPSMLGGRPAYTETRYDTNGYSRRYIEYSDAGIDGLWMTADDLARVYIDYIFDSKGNLIRTIRYLSGIDGLWMSADDLVRSYTDYQFDAGGCPVRSVFYSDSGMDGLWFTKDDLVNRYDNGSCNADGRILWRIFYSTAGADEMWFTSDDVSLNGYSANHFNEKGDLVRGVKYIGAGIDGIWLTEDDQASPYYRENVFDENGNFSGTIDFYSKGADNILFTLDDVASFRTDNIIDANGNQIRSIDYIVPNLGLHATRLLDDKWRYFTNSYRGSIYDANGNLTRMTTFWVGLDGVVDTSDDVAKSHTDYSLDANGNWVQEVTYNDAGADAILFTEDDVIESVAFYDTSI